MIFTIYFICFTLYGEVSSLMVIIICSRPIRRRDLITAITGQLFRPHLVSSAVRSQLSMQENDLIIKKDDLSDNRLKWLNCL